MQVPRAKTWPSSAPSLVEFARREAPDVVVTDLRMPPGFADEGIEAATQIRSTAPQIGLMLLSQYPLCARYGLPYNSAPLRRHFGTTTRKTGATPCLVATVR